MGVIFVGVVVLLVGACAMDPCLQWPAYVTRDDTELSVRLSPLFQSKVTSTSGSIAAVNTFYSFHIIMTIKIFCTQQNVYQ